MKRGIEEVGEVESEKRSRNNGGRHLGAPDGVIRKQQKGRTDKAKTRVGARI